MNSRQSLTVSWLRGDTHASSNKKKDSSLAPTGAVRIAESRALLHAGGLITGSVYIDANSDGTRDANEIGVPGLVVDLSGTDSTDAPADRSTITDDNGFYAFDELYPGTYEISKRQSTATIDAEDSSSVSGATTGNNRFSDLILADDQSLGSINFTEAGLRPEFFSIAWFFASAPPTHDMLRETMALAEELAGNVELAASIRASSGDVNDAINSAPLAMNDLFAVEQDNVLMVDVASGLLANDFDVNGDSLSAALVGQAGNGVVSLNDDGSFTYTPNSGFNGVDSFTYETSDGTLTSSLATVTVNVNQANQAPIASNDDFTVAENAVLTVGERHGVLANDTDPDGDVLTADIIDQVANGVVALNSDGSFTYTPNTDFSGQDSFTYQANDGAATSSPATATITITPAAAGNGLFGPVTPGSFESANLLGARTDLVAGAPPLSAEHVNGDIDYSDYSNPPTYGPHHGFDPNDVDGNPGITPRPTGVYTTEQPDEDLIHNLEHGHVWISYNPNLISSGDLAALEQLVLDGSPNANGGGVGVILTPREANDTMIALASWARLLTLDDYDPATVRDFVETNRGQAPEGFITP